MEESEILDLISDMELSIGKVEKELTLEEFKEYCNNTYSLITNLQEILKKRNNGN